jgi:hypothetical protein
MMNDQDTKRAKRRERAKAWRAANPKSDRDSTRRGKYELTANAFDALLAAQSNVCRICERPNPDCVDHCHATGRIRSVLCMHCNAALGFFRDDVALLRAAAAYLKRST